MKRTVCVLLALLLAVTGLVGSGVSAGAAYSVGEVIAFGSYPQTRVRNNAMIAALDMAAGEWKSYGFYSGSGFSWDDGQMTPKDFMQYCDVTLDEEMYRGVTFSQYRPRSTGATSKDSRQSDNGYKKGVTYWFRYEPLRWRVLDADTGLALCETIIDSQPLNNYLLSVKTNAGGYDYWGDPDRTHYANDYAESSLRQWLNDDFYNTAFTSQQQDAIAQTRLDNRACDPQYAAYDSAATTDRIFLLSYDDTLNTAYGFTADTDKAQDDLARKVTGSDYAKCQGLEVASNGYSVWWLRSAGSKSEYGCCIGSVGWTDSYFFNCVNETDNGIRPALCLVTEPDPVETFTVTVQASSGGTVSGGGTFETGAQATVTAAPDDGCTFTGWFADGSKVSDDARYTFTVTEDVSLTAQFAKTASPAIAIRNYTADRSIGYRATITFSANVTNAVSDAQVHWWIDGKDSGTGDVYTVKEARKDFTVQAKYVRNSEVLAVSETETVRVNSGFFARLIAFFRALFGRLPKQVQAFPAAQHIERIFS